MRFRPAIAAAALLVVTGSTLASAGLSAPVSVHVGTENGGVQVGTSMPGQPLVGARADRGGICVGFSYQMPFCLPVSLA